MAKLMDFLRQRRNREVLGWLGGGLGVVAGGAWAVFTYFNPAPPRASDVSNHSKAEVATPAAPAPVSPGPAAPTNVSASNGSVAIGGSVSNSTIMPGR